MIGKVLAGALVAMAVWAPAAAGHSHFRVVTPNGSHFLFHTSEALVPSDNDSAKDLYLRSGGKNKLVTPGTRQEVSHGAWALSSDGSRVVFETREALLPTDTDAALDVYERAAGEYRLLSAGPSSNADVTLDEVSDDATRVIFTTQARLVPTDADSADDIYAHANGVTTLVSTSTSAAGGEHGASALDASIDGTRVFFWTREALVPFDRDGGLDIYQRDGATTRLVSTGRLDTGLVASDFEVPTSMGYLDPYSASDDGSSFVFMSTLPFEPGDQPNNTTTDTPDLYQWKDGRTRLLTANRAGISQPCDAETGEPVGACQDYEATQTSDGSSVAFRAGQRLTEEDTNNALDVYVRTGDSIRHVGQGVDPRIRHDGAKIVFESIGQLGAADTDSFMDVYEHANGQNRLLTVGQDGDTTFTSRTSRDFSRVFTMGWGSYVPEDADGQWDYYVASGGQMRLVSTGPLDDHAPGGSAPSFVASSDDGTRFYFRWSKALVPEDTDSAEDIYEWRDGVTTLVTGSG